MGQPQSETEDGKVAEVEDAQLENPDNGGKGAEQVEPEELVEADVGPAPAPQRRPKRPLQFEQAYLDSLPCANMCVNLS